MIRIVTAVLVGTSITIVFLALVMAATSITMAKMDRALINTRSLSLGVVNAPIAVPPATIPAVFTALSRNKFCLSTSEV